MTKPTKISVIIRTKNRKRLLQQAIDSIMQQSYSHIEIIIINDGGEDVASIISDIPKDANKSCQYINMQPGKGRAYAANAGLEAATGSLLAFLDDDDWLDSEHFTCLVDTIQNSEQHLVVYSSVRTVYSDEERCVENAFAFPYERARLYVENFIPLNALLFSRKIIDQGCRFDTQFDYLEDWDFLLQMATITDFVFAGKCTANYRITDSSGFGTKNIPEINALRIAVYKKWLTKIPDICLLEIMDRCRQFPTLQHCKTEQSIKISEQHKNLEALRNERTMILSSRSWRITRPLRFVWDLYERLTTTGFLKKQNYQTALPQYYIPQNSRISKNYSRLNFEHTHTPEISIIIPVFNQYLYTFSCLVSILNNSSDISYEVIVVNDCSTDKTEQMLEQINGIISVHNQQNMGFIRSCNRGAEKAKGTYLLFLNNDTKVTHGWLQALRQTFQHYPDAGLVGSRLIFPNGKLQEAGGIVWKDGRAWNYGYNDDPNKPEYSYCREVDYCSGACIMIQAHDFHHLGMFDEHYLPAYYEDTDLAFKVREMGKKVYYQPQSVVIHFEGISCGTNVQTGVKRYQVINHQKFYQRWHKTLDSHRILGDLPSFEKERHVKKCILAIDSRILMPDNDSGSLRMYHLLQILQNLQYKVTFVASDLAYHQKYTPLLQSIGIECLYAPYVSSIEEHLRVEGNIYNIVLISRINNAQKYLDKVRSLAPQAKIIFDTVDLHFLREQRQAEITKNPQMQTTANNTKNEEMHAIRKADITLVVSTIEIDIIKQQIPQAKLALISNIHQLNPTSQPFDKRSNILFIGSFEHLPNIDALSFFIDEIFPILHQNKPEIKLLIIGPNPPKKLTQKANSHIQFLGFVANLKPLFHQIKLSIAPLRYGAGVKGKINLSMSHNVPVVATTIAAEGMHLEHNKNILLANTPEDFAAQIIRLYDDENLWQELSEAGQINIRDYFSFDVAQKNLQNILNGL